MTARLAWVYVRKPGFTVPPTLGTALCSPPFLSRQQLLTLVDSGQVKILLNAAGSVRPAAQDISRAPFFDSVPLMALRFLGALVQKEDVKKAEFLKGLPRVLPDLPKRVIHQQARSPSGCLSAPLAIGVVPPLAPRQLWSLSTKPTVAPLLFFPLARYNLLLLFTPHPPRIPRRS